MTDNYATLLGKIITLASKVLVSKIEDLSNNIIKPQEQNHSEATYAKKISKMEGKINWQESAKKVLAKINGLNPNPGAWFEFDKERFKVLKAKVSSEKGKSGYAIDDNLTVGCETGAIQILELQRQGKKKQTTKEFLLGKKITKGMILV